MIELFRISNMDSVFDEEGQNYVSRIHAGLECYSLPWTEIVHGKLLVLKSDSWIYLNGFQGVLG